MSFSSEIPVPGGHRVAFKAGLLPGSAPVAGYSIALVAALAVQATISAPAGTAACAVLVAALLGHHVVSVRDTDPRLDPLLALALVALAAILAVALPIDSLDPVLWPVIVGLPLVLGIRRAARRLGLHRRELGLIAGHWPVQVAIAAAGVPLGLAIAVVLEPAPLVAPTHWPALAGAAAAIGVFAGAGEELLMRGVLQPLVVGAVGPSGVAWTSALTGALYLGSHSAAVVATAAALGLAFGMLRRRTGSVAGIATAHALIVAGALLLWPQVLGTAPERPNRCTSKTPAASVRAERCPSHSRGRAVHGHHSP